MWLEGIEVYVVSTHHTTVLPVFLQSLTVLRERPNQYLKRLGLSRNGTKLYTLSLLTFNLKGHVPYDSFALGIRFITTLILLSIIKSQSGTPVLTFLVVLSKIKVSIRHTCSSSLTPDRNVE